MIACNSTNLHSNHFTKSSTYANIFSCVLLTNVRLNTCFEKNDELARTGVYTYVCVATDRNVIVSFLVSQYEGMEAHHHNERTNSSGSVTASPFIAEIAISEESLTI